MRNTRFVKRGLTQVEASFVANELAMAKSLWDYLFSLNKWNEPTPPPKASSRSPRPSRANTPFLLFLDGYPYVELTARKQADFLTEVNAWKRKTYPSLARSDVRFFTLAPSGEIKELAFNR
jgi:hypothetical protein